MHRYTLYGVTLQSNRPLPGLAPPRTDDAARPITVEFAGALMPVPAFAPFCTSGFETLWHLDARRWLLQYRHERLNYTWSALYDADTIVLRWNDDAILDDIPPVLQGPAVAAALHLRGIPLLHACVLAIDDFAVALMGAPGAGKSTTAAAFVAAGHALVSDDLGALDLNGSVRVQSGYPRLRLFADSARAAGFDETKLQRAFNEESLGDKYYVDLDGPAFRGGSSALRCIYILQPRRKGGRETTITALEARASIPLLMQNLYSVRFLDKPRLQNALRDCAHIAANVAVRTVQAADDLSALPSLVTTIAADARSLA
jgi:hypothetical protein